MVVGVMLIFPPYITRFPNGVSRNSGFAFIVTGPGSQAPYATVDVLQLLVQWVGVCIMGAIAYMLAGKANSVGPLPSKSPVTFQEHSDRIDPARSAAVRARGWLLPGFLVGFAIGGNTLVADFSLRIGTGLLCGVTVYGIAAAYYLIRKPPDHGDGGILKTVLRIAIVAALAAAIGIVLAIVVPAATR